MLQLKIEPCHQDNAESISEFLEDLGALAVTMTDQFDDPILEPEPGSVPLWPHVVLHAIYDADCNIDHIIDTIQQTHPQLCCSISHVENKDWERVCLDDLKPQQFGKRLWVCPSWLTPPEPDAVNLILDPGLAFGTGTHPTTGLCLTWLAEHELNKKTVIDYGCGSGILGIAALKLGASHVSAVDIDEQALIATQQNAKTNHIDSHQLVVDYPDKLNIQADILIANILLAPLLSLRPRFETLLSSKGTLVVSGILASQVNELEMAYKSTFRIIENQKEGDWAMIALEMANKTI